MTLFRSGNLARSGLVLLASHLAEETTQEDSSVDMVELAGLNIPEDVPLLLTFSARKSAGAADTASLGLELNLTSVRANFAFFSGTDEAQRGYFQVFIPPRLADYGFGQVRGNRDGTIVDAGFSAAAPVEPLTSLVITGEVADTGITLGVADVRLYALR
jgi:hypothetical protein